MINFLCSILLVYGVCNIIAYSKIFNGIRGFIEKRSNSLYEFITCMMCLPFWVGITFNGVVHHFEMQNNFMYIGANDNNIFVMIIYGIIVGSLYSGTTWLIHTMQEKLER